MKPQRTIQVVGIVIGSLLVVVSATVTQFLVVSRIKPAVPDLSVSGMGDPEWFKDNLRTMTFASTLGNGCFVLGLTTIIISVVFFVRAGRTMPGVQKM